MDPVLLSQLEAIVRERLQVEELILFGSYAYGEPGEQSDIDLLAILDGRPSRTAVEKLERELAELAGREVDLLAYGKDDLADQVEAGNAAIRDAVRDGRLLGAKGQSRYRDVAEMWSCEKAARQFERMIERTLAYAALTAFPNNKAEAISRSIRWLAWVEVYRQGHEDRRVLRIPELQAITHSDFGHKSEHDARACAVWLQQQRPELADSRIEEIAERWRRHGMPYGMEASDELDEPDSEQVEADLRLVAPWVRRGLQAPEKEALGLGA